MSSMRVQRLKQAKRPHPGNIATVLGYLSFGAAFLLVSAAMLGLLP